MKYRLILLASSILLLLQCTQRKDPGLIAVEQQGYLLFVLDRAHDYALKDFRRQYGDTAAHGRVLPVVRNLDAVVYFLTPGNDSLMQTTSFPVDTAFLSGCHDDNIGRLPKVKMRYQQPRPMSGSDDTLLRMYQIADSLSARLRPADPLRNRSLAFCHPVYGNKIFLYAVAANDDSLVWGHDYEISLHNLQDSFVIRPLHAYSRTPLDSPDATRHVHPKALGLGPMDYFLLRRIRHRAQWQHHHIDVTEAFTSWHIELPAMHITPDIRMR